MKKSKRNKPQKRTDVEEKILTGCQDGLIIGDAGVKGRGVFTTKSFSPGDFLCEYTGDLITANQGKERERKEYNLNPPKYGSFVFYFVDDACRNMCIDSTTTVSGRVGRLVNHVSVGGNVTPRPVRIDDVTKLIFFASRSIKEGEELLYDYGDRRKSVIEGGNEFLVEAPADAGMSK